MAKPAIQFIDLKAQQARLGDALPLAMQRVLEHGQYIMGPEVGELERRLGEFCGARHVISCASGTDALLMALLSFGVKAGDAVLVPSFTFIATAEVVALLGARPLFVDVDAATFLMDVNSLKEAIRAGKDSGLSVKGVIAVDLFGLPADYEAITALAEEEGLFVIGDAAQSFGTEIGGRKVGTLARLSTTSFFPAKPLGCYGDGGALFTDDDALAERLKSIRVHGKGKDKYDNVNIGINGRLDTLQAAILLEKLAIFPEEIAARNALAARYTKALDGAVQVPLIPAQCRSSWAQYTVQVQERERIMQGLKQAGVPTAVYYPTPLHRQSAYRHYPQPVPLAVSEALSASVLSLPMHPYLDEQTQDFVIHALGKALR